MTKELERKMEAMGESIGRVILQGMLEDAWDKGVEQERRNTEKEREHAIVAFISFGIPNRASAMEPTMAPMVSLSPP